MATVLPVGEVGDDRLAATDSGLTPAKKNVISVNGEEYETFDVFRGGQAVVYKARRVLGADSPLRGRAYAIKVYDRLVGASSVESFAREERVAKRMYLGPNLVPIVDVDVDKGIVVMPFVNGNLNDLMRRAHPSGDGPEDFAAYRRAIFGEGMFGSFERGIEVMTGVANGLDFLHGLGIIHRDVKPANVLLEGWADEKIQVFVTDWGLAKDKDASKRSMENMVKGTASYIAPESMRGEYYPKSDVFSLGVMMLSFFTGDRPFHNASSVVDVLNMRLRGEGLPRTISEIKRLDPGLSDDLGKLILRCLDDNPDRRPSAGDVRDALLAITVSKSQGHGLVYVGRVEHEEALGREEALRRRLADEQERGARLVVDFEAADKARGLLQQRVEDQVSAAAEKSKKVTRRTFLGLGAAAAAVGAEFYAGSMRGGARQPEWGELYGIWSSHYRRVLTNPGDEGAYGTVLPAEVLRKELSVEEVAGIIAGLKPLNGLLYVENVRDTNTPAYGDKDADKARLFDLASVVMEGSQRMASMSMIYGRSEDGVHFALPVLALLQMNSPHWLKTDPVGGTVKVDCERLFWSGKKEGIEPNGAPFKIVSVEGALKTLASERYSLLRAMVGQQESGQPLKVDREVAGSSREDMMVQPSSVTDRWLLSNARHVQLEDGSLNLATLHRTIDMMLQILAHRNFTAAAAERPEVLSDPKVLANVPVPKEMCGRRERVV